MIKPIILKAQNLILKEVLEELRLYSPAILDLKAVLRIFKDISSRLYWREKGVDY